MLEQRSQEPGSAVSTLRTTHMLAAHGGDIYMHSLASYRDPLEEPPTITECIGGKCTDYRIQVRIFYPKLTFIFHSRNQTDRTSITYSHLKQSK